MIGIPVMLQALIQSLVSLVDNFMVAGLGDVKMSGVSVAGQILFVFMVLSNAICAAGGIYMTQFSGAKNKAGMRQALRFKFYLLGSFIAVYLLVCLVFPRQILSMMVVGNTEAEAILDAGEEYMRLMGFMGHWELLFLVENGVGGRVVVHLHLTIDFHVLATCLNVFQQLVNGQREVALLLQQHVELGLALGNVAGVCVLTLSLLLHVPYLQRQDAETVYRPCGTLSIQSSIGQDGHIAVELTEIGVDVFHQVGTVLVGVVYTAFQRQSLDGVDVRVAYDVLQMPLYGIYPALQIEVVLYGVTIIGVVDSGIYMIFQVVVSDDLIEDIIGLLCKSHIR